MLNFGGCVRTLIHGFLLLLTMERVGQPCEMPREIEYWDEMPALGQLQFEPSAILRANIGLWYRMMRMMPGSKSGKKDRDSLRFLGCRGNFQFLLVMLVKQSMQAKCEVINK